LVRSAVSAIAKASPSRSKQDMLFPHLKMWCLIFWRAERLPKHLILFIPGQGTEPPPYRRTPQLCCYLLHFSPSPVSGATNPSALPRESASGEIHGLEGGCEDIGGNRANGLPDPRRRVSGPSRTHRSPLGAPEGPKSHFRVPEALKLDLARISSAHVPERRHWGDGSQNHVLGAFSSLRSVSFGGRNAFRRI